MNKRERMYQDIKKHGDTISAIFGVVVNSDQDAIALSKKLFCLEQKAHQLSTDYCNGVIDSEVWDKETDKILEKVDSILGFKKLGVPVFVNGDARGYALKISDEYVRDNKLDIYRDWGGYGILAPDFSN